VVIVYVQIPLGPDGHINQRMARKLVKHVVKKPDACLVVISTGTVKVDLNRDVSFSGGTGQCGLAHLVSPNDGFSALIAAVAVRPRGVT
jgi:hypothetical protein